MTVGEKIEIRDKVHAALAARDWSALRALLADDATWALPGDNPILEKAVGADEVTALAQRIAGFGLNVALICRLRDGKVAEIETYLSDIDGMSAFLT
jgi:hypothetical protein